jgi:LmbE family N-acetylglucosaminyl deacetylase
MSLDCARSSDDLLAALAKLGPCGIDGTRVAAVFAHPDDETIACGAQLPRLEGASIVIVTDGAPRNLRDAHRLGFATAEAYAAARQQELAAALRIAGVGADRVVNLGVPDQEAALRLVQVTLMLTELLARRHIRSVLTHAYEGGHPDHDAAAFCVHAAAALRRREQHHVTLIEAPFYSLGPSGGIARQQFPDGPSSTELTLPLTAEQRELKRSMIAAHRSQRAVLAAFALHVERFRPAPRYDFSQPPNGGRLLYDQQRWGLDGRPWSGLSCSTGARLGLGDGPC